MQFVPEPIELRLPVLPLVGAPPPPSLLQISSLPLKAKLRSKPTHRLLTFTATEGQIKEVRIWKIARSIKEMRVQCSSLPINQSPVTPNGCTHQQADERTVLVF
jgi:hypothetical protein